MTLACLIDGVPQSTVAADNRGLAYGDGVFRTILVADGAPLHLDDHLAKLADDVTRLQLDMPSPALLRAESQALIAARQDARAVLKWTLVRRHEGRGYRSSTCEALRIVSLAAAPRYADALWEQGACADWSPLTLSVQPRLAGIKHLNRLEQVLASRDWPAGIDERLMCDHAGHLIGGTRSNLFWLRAGRLQTPRLDQCGVAGSMRARIVRLAQQQGLPAEQQQTAPQTLLDADEAFICNALIGIWPLRQIAERRFAAPGPWTRRLMTALNHPRLN